MTSNDLSVPLVARASCGYFRKQAPERMLGEQSCFSSIKDEVVPSGLETPQLPRHLPGIPTLLQSLSDHVHLARSPKEVSTNSVVCTFVLVLFSSFYLQETQTRLCFSHNIHSDASVLFCSDSGLCKTETEACFCRQRDFH